MTVSSAVMTALLPALLPLLEGVDGPAREAAIDSLASARIPMRAMNDALDTAGWRGRQGIVESAARRGEESVTFLCRAAELSAWRDVRRRAILALGEVGGPAALDSLTAILARTEEMDVAIHAIGNLAALPLQATVAGHLDDRNANVRRQAVVGIGRLGEEGNPSLVVPLLDDVHHSVRFAAAEALGQMGASATAAIRGQFDAMSARGRYASLRALGAVGGPLSTRFLIEAASGEDRALAVSAAVALGEHWAEMDVAQLEACLQQASVPLVVDRLRSAIDRARSTTED